MMGLMMTSNEESTPPSSEERTAARLKTLSNAELVKLWRLANDATIGKRTVSLRRFKISLSICSVIEAEAKRRDLELIA